MEGVKSCYIYSLPADGGATGVAVTLMAGSVLISDGCFEACIDTETSDVVTAPVDNSTIVNMVEPTAFLLSLVVAIPADVVSSSQHKVHSRIWCASLS